MCPKCAGGGGILLTLIATLLFSITSCDNPAIDDFDDDITNTIDNTEIFGTWAYTQNDASGQITFNEDGTSFFKQNKDSNPTYQGAYSLSDSILSVKVSWTMESTGVTSSYNEKYSATISDDKLTLKFKSGRWEVSTSKDKQKSSTTDCLIAQLWQNTTGEITLDKVKNNNSEDENNTPNDGNGTDGSSSNSGDNTGDSSNDSSSTGTSDDNSTGDSSNDSDSSSSGNDTNDSSNGNNSAGDSSNNDSNTGDSSNSDSNTDSSSSGNDTNNSSNNNNSEGDSANNDDNNGNSSNSGDNNENDTPVYDSDVIIPSDVTEITQEYFHKLCTDSGTSYDLVEKLVIPKTVTSIGSNAFCGCTNLASVTIPNSVTSIKDGAFAYCTSLASITIPNSVTSIGQIAFCGSSLESITIPDSVTSIGVIAFSGCPNLASITVDSGNKYFSSEDDVLFNKDKTTLMCYPAGKTNSTFSIPDSVTSIDYGTFYGCTSLESISIPSNVTSIGDFAFNLCTSLTSVNIPDGVTSIGYGVFSGCTNLTIVDIPDNVISIGNSAFSSCKSLASITIPSNVTSIDEEVFAYCTSLTSVKVEAIKPPELSSSAFKGVPTDTLKIHVPTDSVVTYKSADGWSDYADQIYGI